MPLQSLLRMRALSQTGFKAIPYLNGHHILCILCINLLETKLHIIVQRPLYSMFGIPIMHNLQMSSSTSQFRRTIPQLSFSRCSNHNRHDYTSGRRICSRSYLTTQRQLGTGIVATYPEPETEKERSPIDFPQECQSQSCLVYFICLL